MEYQLAKQLKNAGFLQKGLTWFRYNYPDIELCNCDISQFEGQSPNEKEDIYIPTLEELVESCGDGFDSIYRDSDGNWEVEQPLVQDYSGQIPYKHKGEGKTPTEAVANLWLKLNEVK